MYYVVDKQTGEILAIETVRPPDGWYTRGQVVYSTGSYQLTEVVDPAVICTRYIKATPDVIAANGKPAIIEVSEYGDTVDLDIAGTVHTFDLVNNFVSFELVGISSGDDIVIRGVTGDLANIEETVYVR